MILLQIGEEINWMGSNVEIWSKLHIAQCTKVLNDGEFNDKRIKGDRNKFPH